jgi:hypothetical protein
MQQMMLYHSELVPTADPSVVPIPNIKDLQVESSGQPPRFAAIVADLAEAKVLPPSSLHPKRVDVLLFNATFYLFIYKHV